MKCVRKLTRCLPVLASLVIPVTAAAQNTAQQKIPNWYVRGIVAALLDPTDGVAAAALSFPNMDAVLAEVGTSAALTKHRQQITVFLLDSVVSGRGKTQLKAVEALGELNRVQASPSDVAKLIDLVKKGEQPLAGAAAKALSRMSSTAGDHRGQLLRALLDLAKNARGATQAEACDSLGSASYLDEAEQKEALDVLLTCASSSEQRTRQIAAKALGNMVLITRESRQAVSRKLAIFLNDQSPVREAAAAALARILKDTNEQSDVFTKIVEVLQSDDLGKRQSAANALSGIARLDEATLDKLQKFLVDLVMSLTQTWIEDKAVRTIVSRGELTDAHRQELSELMIRRLFTNRPTNFDALASGLDVLLKNDEPARTRIIEALLSTSSIASPRATFTTLGYFDPVDDEKHRRVLDAILAAAKDSKDDVKTALAFALGRIKPRSTSEQQAIGADEFANERPSLEALKLVVPRPMVMPDGKQAIVYRFRHDKVSDVLIKPAFDQDPRLQIEAVDDPRFRGVYLLYAQAEDRDVAQKLRDLLVSRAVHTRDQSAGLGQTHTEIVNT